MFRNVCLDFIDEFPDPSHRLPCSLWLASHHTSGEIFVTIHFCKYEIGKFPANTYYDLQITELVCTISFSALYVACFMFTENLMWCIFAEISVP